MQSSTLLDDKSLDHFARILYVLSRKDNFIIFVLAKDGLRSKTSTPQTVGLTKKQYYTRLNQLLHVGLIRCEPHTNTYFHTTLGKIIFHTHISPMMQEIKNFKSLMMVDALKNTNRFSDVDIEMFVSPILERLNLPLPQSEKPPGIRMVFSDVDVERAIKKCLQLCERDICLSTRSHIKYLMQQVMLKAVGGVKVRILADSDLDMHLGEKIENVLIQDLRETNELSALKYLQIQENVTTLKAKVLFDMLFLDDRFLIIGLIDRRNVERYNAAIIIEDVHVARMASEHFWQLWTAASKDANLSVAE